MEKTFFTVFLLAVWASIIWPGSGWAEEFILIPDAPDLVGPGKAQAGEGASLHYFQFNDLYGYIDGSGRIVIPPAFSKAENFHKCGLARVADREGRYGFIDAKGQWVVLPGLEEAGISVSGEKDCGLVGRKYNRWGALDLTGRWLFKPRFAELSYLGRQQYAAAYAKEGLKGLLDSKGAWLVKPAFESVYFSETIGGQDFIKVYKNKMSGFIDRAGSYLINPVFDSIYWQSGAKLFSVSQGQDRGMVDLKGSWLIKTKDPVYVEYQSKFNELWVRSDTSIVAYTLAGARKRVPPRSDIWAYVNELKYKLTSCSEVGRPSNWGFCNSDGRVVFQGFSRAYDFSDFGLAEIQKGSKCGYVDPKGRQAITPRFDYCSRFRSSGVAEVRVGELYGVTNAKGTLIVKANYKSLNIDDDFNLIFVSAAGDKNGINRINGSPLFEPVFDKTVTVRKMKRVAAQYQGKWGFLNLDGTWLIRPKFDEIMDFYSHDDMMPVIYRTKFALLNNNAQFIAYNDVACGQYVVRNGADKIIWPPPAVRSCR